MSNGSVVQKLVGGSLAISCGAIVVAWTVGAPAQELPLSHPPQAQMAWTTIGAVGAPDDGDAELIRLGANGAAAIADGVAFPAEAVLRYNVLPVLGLYASPDNHGAAVPRCLTVTFRDNGPDARVIVTLKRVVGDPQSVRTIATFDSDFLRTGAPRGSTDPNFQQDAVCNIPTYTFAGMNAVGFFVEAQLVRTSPTGNPGLQLITIEADPQ